MTQTEQRLERIEMLLSINMKEVFDADECAVYLGIERSTLYNKCARREIPHYRNGTKLRFRKSEIDDWRLGDAVPVVDPERFADDYCVQRKIKNRR